MQREMLIQFRKAIKKTQDEMANTWGITSSFYKQIECGSKNPSIKNLKKFKEVFPAANVVEIFLS